MTTPTVVVTEVARLQDVQKLLFSLGPCITIVQPGHNGQGTGIPVIGLHSKIAEAAEQLRALGIPDKQRDDLIEPLRYVIEDPALQQPHRWGYVVFRAPDVLKLFRLTHNAQERVRVGDMFSVRSLAEEFVTPYLFHILTLSQKKAALIRREGLSVEFTPLPPGVPESVADAMGFDTPERDLENRSSAGRATGSMKQVRFGTGTDLERLHTHVQDYYRMVDRGLSGIARAAEIPLILAGPHEDIAAYRAISQYPSLMSGSIQGAMDRIRHPEELLDRAYAILREDYLSRALALLANASKNSPREQFSANLTEILAAARQGRVHQLFLNQQREDIGKEDGSGGGSDDRMNAAAVQTLLHHGSVYEIPAANMPEGSAAVAAMRY